METEQTPVQLKVEWKLEKFNGEPGEGANPPVEVLQGSVMLPIFEEVSHGSD